MPQGTPNRSDAVLPVVLPRYTFKVRTSSRTRAETMGFFGSLFGIKKMNADPDQQVFARLFIAAAESKDTKSTN
jgi:hypothetical protein